jgi:hypothetical protein
MPQSIQRSRWRVILLPGGVLPAAPAYQNLLAELGSDADARTKDLEVYATDRPPPDFSVDTEVGGITRVAGEAGFDRFHLVGYSGGGGVIPGVHSRLAGSRPQPCAPRTGLGRQ